MKANEFITNVAEISIKYNYKVKAKDRVKAADSNKLAEAFFSVFDKSNIEVQETAYCAILDRNFGIIGIIKIGEGNGGTTVMNMDKTYQAAILCNGYCIALCHNHPSGNLKPSSEDKMITSQFKQASLCLGKKLIDHIIISPDGDFLSFNDEGLL